MHRVAELTSGIIPDPIQKGVDKIPHQIQQAIVTLLLAFFATVIARFVIHTVIRRLSSASLSGGKSKWVGLLSRTGLDDRDIREERRRQRIDAASRMVSHLVSLGIWIIATIAVFHQLDIDPTFYLSGAGFLGAGLAIGGQHKVNDYLTGLSVHFEDRYGVGDTVTVEPTNSHADVTAVVEHIGLFSTRLNDGQRTYHFPNSSIANIVNLSQRPAVSKLRVQVPEDTSPDEVSNVIRDLAGSDGLTDILLVGDLEAYRPTEGEVEVELRTPQRMSPKKLQKLERRTQRRFPEPAGGNTPKRRADD